MGEPHNKDAAPMAAGPGRGPGRGPGPGFHGPVQKPKNLGRTLLRIGSYLKDDKRSFLLVIVSVLLNSLLSIVGPVIVGLAIDDYITPGDYRGLLLISLGLLAIYILNSLFAFLQGFFMASVSERTVARMRRDLLRYLPDTAAKIF